MKEFFGTVAAFSLYNYFRKTLIIDAWEGLKTLIIDAWNLFFDVKIFDAERPLKLRNANFFLQDVPYTALMRHRYFKDNMKELKILIDKSKCLLLNINPF